MQKNNKAVNLEDFCQLLDLYKDTTEKTLYYVKKAYEHLQEVERLNKEIRIKLNTTFKAPTKLTVLEKIIYYFNRKHNLTLEKIAEISGYHPVYILEKSAKINHKLKHIPSKTK